MLIKFSYEQSKCEIITNFQITLRTSSIQFSFHTKQFKSFLALINAVRYSSFSVAPGIVGKNDVLRTQTRGIEKGYFSIRLRERNFTLV